MKIKTILCIALAAAFAVSCNQKTNNTTVSEGQTSAPQAGSIVYIQLDSIVAKFDMFNDLKSELEERYRKSRMTFRQREGLSRET